MDQQEFGTACHRSLVFEMIILEESPLLVILVPSALLCRVKRHQGEQKGSGGFICVPIGRPFHITYILDIEERLDSGVTSENL